MEIDDEQFGTVDEALLTQAAGADDERSAQLLVRVGCDYLTGTLYDDMADTIPEL